MMTHQELGKKGEEIAMEYLQKKGFEVIEKNYRYTNLEIDIIARKNTTLHFVEVKTRSQYKYGNPIEAVNREKINHIKKVANAYLENLNLLPTLLQFDVIGIYYHNENEYEIEWVEDIF